MFVNHKKELDKTIGNVKLSCTKQVDPLLDFSKLNSSLAKNITHSLNVVQQYTIPIILEGNDLICKAPTGSGKTLCYIIPIIEKIIKNADSKAVIICPVRELCEQIKNVTKDLVKNILVRKSSKSEIYYAPSIKQSISVTAIYGQKRDMDEALNANILIATPGRLIDNLSKKKISFDNLTTIIFDEADRLYDSTFKAQIDTIKSFIKSDVQTCMFSATYPPEIKNLFDVLMKKERICLEAEFECKSNVKQELYSDINKIDKITEILKSLVLVGSWRDTVEVEKVIIFVERKADCLKLALALNQNCLTLHGDKNQFERNEAIKKFKTSHPILIATSVAARGLDIKDVKLVINYDLPRTIDEYIHRIGRTGRAEAEGRAVSFFDWNTDANMSSGLIKVLQDTKQEVPEFLLNRYHKKNVRPNKIKSRSQEKLRKNKSKVYTPNNMAGDPLKGLEENVKDMSVKENDAESEDEELGTW